MKNISSLILKIVILILLFNACSNNEWMKKDLPKKNLTEYNFNTNIKLLYNVILTDLSPLFVQSAIDYKYEPGDYKELYKIYLKRKCKYDIFIGLGQNFGYSKMYFSNEGDSLKYNVEFYLALDSLDSNKTKVTIYTINPRIVIGRGLLPEPPHFVRRNIYMSIEPTTIEEYEILLEIGKLTEEQNMPPLILPNN